MFRQSMRPTSQHLKPGGDESANGAFGRNGSSLFRGQIAVLGHTLGKLIRL
jgi:hypothetical protein